MTKSISSTFALLDVKQDRAALAKRMEAGERVPVVITGTIASQWGDDDGTSIEFEVDVTSATEGEPAVSGATLNTETALALVAKIEAFDRDCGEAEHTDADDAWKLLHLIADRLRDTLDAGQLVELNEMGNRHRAEIASQALIEETINGLAEAQKRRVETGIFFDSGEWFYEAAGESILGPFETELQAVNAAASATKIAAAA